MGTHSSQPVKEPPTPVIVKHQKMTLATLLILLAITIASLILLVQKSQIIKGREVAQIWNADGAVQPAIFQTGVYNMALVSAQHGVGLHTVFAKAFQSNEYAILNIPSVNETSKTSSTCRAQWGPPTSTIVEVWEPPGTDANNVDWTRYWLNKGMSVFRDYPNAIMWTSIATDKRGTKLNKLEFWMLSDGGSLPNLPIASVVIPTINNGSSYKRAHAYLRYSTNTSITTGYDGMLIFGNGDEILYVSSTSLKATPTIVRVDLAQVRGLYDENVGWDWIVCAGKRLVLKYIRTYSNYRVAYLVCVSLTNGAIYHTWTYWTNTGLNPLAPELSSLSIYPGAADTLIVAFREIATVTGRLLIRKLKLSTNNLFQEQADIAITQATDADPEKNAPYAAAQAFGALQVDGNLPFYVLWRNFESSRMDNYTPGNLVAVRYLLGPNKNQFIRDRTMFIEAEKPRPDYRLYPHVGLREIHDGWNQIGNNDKKGLQIQFSISQTSVITSSDAKTQLVSCPPNIILDPTVYPGRYQGVYNEALVINRTGGLRSIMLGINSLLITELVAPPFFAVGPSV